MNPNRQAQVVPLIVAEVPLPSYPLIIPPKGTVWLRGELTEPVDQYKLEDHLLPPGIYKTVRDDLARYSPLKCSRIALTKHELEYIGVIDSDGDPYYFVLNSLGMRTVKADDKDEAWEAFNELMDRERKAGLEYMRDKTASDMDLYISKGAKPYGHVAYVRHTKTGKTVQVKQKGVKIDEHNVVSNNPYHPEDDQVAHAAHEHLKKHKPAKESDVIFHLSKVAKKHGSTDPTRDARRLYKYLVSNKSFEISADKFSKKSLVRAFLSKKFNGKVDERYARIGVVKLKFRAPRTQLEPEHQKVIREQFHSLVEKYGAINRDATQAEGSKYHIRNLGKRILGIHNWIGGITVAPDVHGKITRYLGRLDQDDNATPDDDEKLCISAVIHETLHGCSPPYLTMDTYRLPRGQQIEEVSTEFAARYITAKEFGGPDAVKGIYKSIMDGSGGSYGSLLKHAFQVIEKHLTQEYGLKPDPHDVVERMFKGCMALKSDKGDDLPPVADRTALTNPHILLDHATKVFVRAVTDDLNARASMTRELWTYDVRSRKSLRAQDQIPFIEAIKKYIAATKHGPIQGWIGEMIAMESGDPDTATKIFDYIDNGGKLPDGWEHDMMPFGLAKALAKKDNTGKDKDAKKTKSVKASSKKAGKNGKTRYNYPEDKKPQGKGGKAKKPGDKKAPGDAQKEAVQTITPQQDVEEAGADPIAVPRQPQPKSVDPQKMANQLQIPVHTLQHIAKRFMKNPKLDGRKGFQQFMKTRLRDFAEKHKLDGDYFGLLYDSLVGSKPTVATTV